MDITFSGIHYELGKSPVFKDMAKGLPEYKIASTAMDCKEPDPFKNKVSYEEWNEVIKTHVLNYPNVIVSEDTEFVEVVTEIGKLSFPLTCTPTIIDLWAKKYKSEILPRNGKLNVNSEAYQKLLQDMCEYKSSEINNLVIFIGINKKLFTMKHNFTDLWLSTIGRCCLPPNSIDFCATKLFTENEYSIIYNQKVGMYGHYIEPIKCNILIDCIDYIHRRSASCRNVVDLIKDEEYQSIFGKQKTPIKIIK